MKRKSLFMLISLVLIVAVFCAVGILVSAEEPAETVTFAPYTDTETGAKQYCACGNKFVADEAGTIAYVNGEDGCKNHKDESGKIIAGCDGTLLTWKPWTSKTTLPRYQSNGVLDETTGKYVCAYYLTDAIELSGQMSISANVKIYLDLNGFEAKGKENTRVYSMHNEGVELDLTDTSAAQTGKISSWGTLTDHSLTLWVRYGTLNMYGGIVDASQMTTTGGTGSYAPGMRVTDTTTFNMFGGKIIGGNCTDTTVGEGAGIVISSGGTMNLYDGEITGGNAYNGGNILVSGTLNAFGGKITSGTAANVGGNICLKAGEVNIQGDVEISGGNAKSGGGIGLLNNNTNRELNISDGTITKNKSTASGGGLYIHGYSKKTSAVNISGGTFSENYAGSNGGAIGFGTSFCSVNITDGKFIDNEAKKLGGHIYFMYGGSHSVTGGNFTGGKAANGGSIGIDGNVNGTVSITGGTFKDGYSSGNGGNFYIYGNASISGATIIGGSGTGGGNIAVYGTATLSNVTVANGEARTGGGGNVFVNVTKDGDTITKAGDLTITSGTYSYGHSAAQGGNVRVENGATLAIQGGRFEYGGINPETNEVVTTQGGNLVILSENTTITGGTFIGGKALQYAGNIRAGRDLTLGSGVTVKDGEAPKGGNLANNSGGALIIDGATITGGKAISAEGISNAGGGGNIYVESGKSLEIKSGTISDGIAVTYGGNIFINHTDSELLISGGTISGGSAANGGSIAIVNGSFTLSGGTISDGEATTSAGNLYVDGETTQFLMSDGTISGGTSKDGGNVRLRGGNHTITGGTITAGSSTSAGANLFTGNSAKLTIENVTITDGNAAGMGGGLYMGSGVVTINNCLIQDNKAKNGGSVAVYAGTLNFNNGKLDGGFATEFGGNIYTDHGTLNIAGGEILNGSTDGYGGGIGMKNSKEGNRTLNITGGLISGNYAKASAGGVYIHGYSGYQSDVVISGGTICNNSSDVNGGGIAMGTSFCTLTITGDAVIRDNTAKVFGGNINMNYGGTKVISGGTITGGTASTGACINVEGKSVTISGTPTIDAIRVNNTADGRLVVSDAAWTTPVALELTGAGVFATADTDKTALFTPIGYELSYENGELIAQQAKHVYVSANGSDTAAGTEAAPVQTLEKALEMVADQGTIHLIGSVEAAATWTAHGKTVILTGGELVLPEARTKLKDSVTFKNIILTLPMSTNEKDLFAKYSFYCNGYKTVIEESVTVRYLFNGTYMTNPYHTATKSDGTTVTGTATLYGGSSEAALAGTDLTVMTGVWSTIYGGSYKKAINGDVHLTVGGKVNNTIDWEDHDNSGKYVIVGGSYQADISGTIYVNVTGGNHTSTHGGSVGGSDVDVTIGNIEMHITGGNAMAFYGGGKGGKNIVTGQANMYFEGGYCEQLFGAGLRSLEGTLNVYATGGQISRRLYGGAYNESSLNNRVYGIVNVYIGKDVNLSFDKLSDRGLFAHSRYDKTVTEVERTRIIFMDKAAYDTHKGKLGAKDLGAGYIMGSATAADYICYLGTNASGNVITVGATEVEDHVNNALDLPAATATIVAEDSYDYAGEALTPATVVYSDNWTYGELEITYANNDTAGTATASISYDGVTATKDFSIVDNRITVIINGQEQKVADLQAAFAAAGEGGFVKLTADVSQNATISTNLYLDLNGHNINGTVTVAKGATLYGMDSTTDDYDCSDGYGKISKIEGNCAPHHKTELDSSVGKILRYLTVKEMGGTSFHRFYVGIQYVTLKPGVTGFGYTAIFGGDEMVKAALCEEDAFGFSLWITEDRVSTNGLTRNDFVSGKTVTLRLKNYDIKNYGSNKVYATVYIKLADGTVISSAVYAYSMQDMLTVVNRDIASGKYSAQQILAVQKMLAPYSDIVSNWGIGDLLNWNEQEN